jgi:hypothetical protein
MVYKKKEKKKCCDCCDLCKEQLYKLQQKSYYWNDIAKRREYQRNYYRENKHRYKVYNEQRKLKRKEDKISNMIARSDEDKLPAMTISRGTVYVSFE